MKAAISSRIQYLACALGVQLEYQSGLVGVKRLHIAVLMDLQTAGGVWRAYSTLL